MNIFNIQHFSIGDGFGIRSTVFFCGCNLRCPWCHNPESIYGDGRDMSVDEVAADVMADKEFYDRSGGGVTLSGGEPLLHFDDCLALAKRFKAEGLNVVIDTALALPLDRLSEIAEYTDSFFVDLKTADEGKFTSVVRGDWHTYLHNLDILNDLGSDIVFRIPLIPGFNMDEKSVGDIISLAKVYGKPFTLLPFHRMGAAKYSELGIKYEYADVQPSSKEETDEIRKRFIAAGLKEANV